MVRRDVPNEPYSPVIGCGLQGWSKCDTVTKTKGDEALVGKQVGQQL